MERGQKLKEVKSGRYCVSKQCNTQPCRANKQLEIDSMLVQKENVIFLEPEIRRTKRTQLFIPLSATITFSMVRQIIFFQRWERIYPDEFLKNIVPFFCQIVHEDSLDHQGFVYFLLTSKNRNKKGQYQAKENKKIDNQSAILLDQQYQPQSAVSCLKINRQMIEILDNVLNRIIFKQGNQSGNQKFNKLFRGVSIQQKFWMLCESRRIVLSFNQFLMRKGAKVNSVFVTVKGDFSEVSTSTDKRYFSHSQFFGFDQIFAQECCWQKSIRSHANGAVVFQISSDLLLKYLNIRLPQRLPSINLPEFQSQIKKNLAYQTSSGPLKKFFIHEKKFKIQIREREKDKSKGEIEHVLDKKEIKAVSLKYREFQKLVGSDDSIKEIFKNTLFIQNMKRYSLSKQTEGKQSNIFQKSTWNILNRMSVDSIFAKGMNQSFQKGKANQTVCSHRRQRDSTQVILKRLKKMQKKHKKPLQFVKRGKYYLRG